MAKTESEAGPCYTLINAVFSEVTLTGPWAMRIGLAQSFPVLTPCVPWPPGSVHLTVGLTSSWEKGGAVLVLSGVYDVSQGPGSLPPDQMIPVFFFLGFRFASGRWSLVCPCSLLKTSTPGAKSEWNRCGWGGGHSNISSHSTETKSRVSSALQQFLGSGCKSLAIGGRLWIKLN